MKKGILVASLFTAFILAGSAFAQKPPNGPENAPEDQNAPGMEEPGRHAPPAPGAMEPGMEERNPAAEKEAREYLKSQIPGIETDLDQLRRDKPDMYHQRFRDYMHAYVDPNLREQFVKNLKLDFQVRHLAKAVREAKGAEKDKLKKDLEKALSEQFDSNLARMEFKLKRMQTEITELRTRIDKRRAVKEQIVKKRLGELTGELETWDW